MTQLIKTVYLAGSIDYRKHVEVIRERNEAITLFNNIGVNVYDPYQNKDEFKDKEISQDISVHSMQEIIHRDLAMIERSDAIVILTGDKASWGTAMEAGYCLAKHKPIFVIENSPEGTSERWGWLRFNAVNIFKNITDLVQYIEKEW